MFIHESDEEMNSEDERKFFAREMEIREIMSKMSALPPGALEKASGVEKASGGTRKRKKDAPAKTAKKTTKRRRVTEAMEVDGDEEGSTRSSPAPARSSPALASDDEDVDMDDSHLASSESEDNSEAESAPPARIRVSLASDDEDSASETERDSPAPKKRGLKPASVSMVAHSNDEEEMDIPIRGKRRARVVDDDDEE